MQGGHVARFAGRRQQAVGLGEGRQTVKSTRCTGCRRRDILQTVQHSVQGLFALGCAAGVAQHGVGRRGSTCPHRHGGRGDDGKLRIRLGRAYQGFGRLYQVSKAVGSQCAVDNNHITKLWAGCKHHVQAFVKPRDWPLEFQCGRVDTAKSLKNGTSLPPGAHRILIG